MKNLVIALIIALTITLAAFTSYSPTDKITASEAKNHIGSELSESGLDFYHKLVKTALRKLTKIPAVTPPRRKWS